MSTKRIDCYVIACDKCGEYYENGDYVVHWDSAEETEVETDDDNWYSSSGIEYCYACRQEVEHEHIWAWDHCEICMDDMPDEEE